MPVTLVGDPLLNWIASFDAVAAGDKRCAGSVTVPFEALAHRTAYLKALKHPATGIERWLRHAESVEGWQTADSAVGAGWKDVVHAANDPDVNTLTFLVDCPTGATIKRIEALIRPATTHSSMPVTRPALKLARWTPAIVGGPALTALASFADTSLTVSDYELPHFVGGNVSVAVDHGASLYRIGFFSEAGNNSKGDMRVDGVRITFDMNFLDEAGS